MAKSDIFDSDEISNYIHSVDVSDLPISFSDLETDVHKFEDLDINPDTYTGLSGITPSLHDDPDVTLNIADREIVYSTLQQPVLQYGRPEKGAFKGDYNFELNVMAGDTHKRKYLYSHKLNRIYVEMYSNFTIHFSWDFHKVQTPAYVRATTVFSSDDQAEKRVERCIQHRHQTANNGIHPSIVSHVLRSTRELETVGVSYWGNKDRKDSWYSVRVEFDRPPDAGSLTHSHAFQFVCKNSCGSGINRRAIEIVFTLEDATGKVLGRQSVGARVCACPRRDMKKDEEGSPPGKRKVSTTPQKCKKIKVEHNHDDDDDDTVYTIPAGMQIVGSKTLKTGFTVMINMMEQVAKYKTNPTEKEKLQNIITSAKTFIDQMENSQT